jgi:hypothetical protein
MRTISLAAIFCTAAAFVAPRRALSAPARSVARQALPETSLLLADLPTLVRRPRPLPTHPLRRRPPRRSARRSERP